MVPVHFGAEGLYSPFVNLSATEGDNYHLDTPRLRRPLPREAPSVRCMDGRMYSNGILRCPGTRSNSDVQQTGAGSARPPRLGGTCEDETARGSRGLLDEGTFVRHPESDEAIIEDNGD